MRVCLISSIRGEGTLSEVPFQTLCGLQVGLVIERKVQETVLYDQNTKNHSSLQVRFVVHIYKREINWHAPSKENQSGLKASMTWHSSTQVKSLSHILPV